MQVDESTQLALRYDEKGLIGAIVVDGASKDVLMFAHMNTEAFAATLRTGRVHFYSRSRNALWMKGETSGEVFRVLSIKVDCDQDCLLVTVAAEGKGNACHTGRRSCFYRKIADGSLVFED
jgi:phosphoribosyl-AMP cyclohydrolase